MGAGGKIRRHRDLLFLDCFPPETLATVVAKLAACATPDAVWLVADFAVPLRRGARWRALAVHALMYAFFRQAVALPARCLTPPNDLLRAQGFAPVRQREFEWGLLRAELWARDLTDCPSGGARRLSGEDSERG